MTTSSPATTSKAAQRHAKAQTHAEVARRQERRRRLMTWVAAGVPAAVVPGGLYAKFRAQTESDASAGAPGDYEVGSPGPGEMAPDHTLASVEGQQVALSDFRGDTVLLHSTRAWAASLLGPDPRPRGRLGRTRRGRHRRTRRHHQRPGGRARPEDGRRRLESRIVPLPFDQHHVLTQILGFGLLLLGLSRWR